MRLLSPIAVSWESLPQEVRTAIEECDEDIRKNGSFTNEEVFQEIAEWLETVDLPSPEPLP